MYQLLRDILFNFDAEAVHHFSMKALKGASDINFLNKEITKNFSVKDDRLAKNELGIYFKNPVGLRAGFDKNAMYL